MYVAVKGGEKAIENSHALLAEARRGDPAVPVLSLAQIEGQLGLAVDRVMAEASLYDRELAALAIKQAQGDLVEAAFLLRAYRTTLPRFGHALPLDTAAMAIRRRISAAFKDLPGGQVLGPKVLLLDQFSASDGDIVGYRFRKHRLGPIIGQRSWGGVVGIRGSLPFLDGGILNRPEFSRFDLEAREWIMEGTGVEPDITVVNNPADEFAGKDDQLTRAIEEIRKLMAAQPVRIPAPPESPDKKR